MIQSAACGLREVTEYGSIPVHYVFKKPMPMGIADGIVTLNGKAIYQANDLKVGLIHK